MGFKQFVEHMASRVSDWEPVAYESPPLPELLPPPPGTQRGLATLAEVHRDGPLHSFVLELDIPGRTPARITLTDRVPAGIEDGDPGDSAVPLAPGIIVPVVATLDDPPVVTVDWSAYLLMPGRQEDAELARNRRRWAAKARQMETATKEQRERVFGNSRTAALALAHRVADGGISRARFDDEMDIRLRSGHLRREDYAEALAILESPEPRE